MREKNLGQQRQRAGGTEEAMRKAGRAAAQGRPRGRGLLQRPLSSTFYSSPRPSSPSKSCTMRLCCLCPAVRGLASATGKAPGRTPAPNMPALPRTNPPELPQTPPLNPGLWSNQERPVKTVVSPPSVPWGSQSNSTQSHFSMATTET